MNSDNFLHAPADVDDCLVLTADTPELRDKVYKLRYQIYCLERQYEPGDDGREFDEYDSGARHILLIHRATGEAIGTVRVIVPSRHGDLGTLPMARIVGTEPLRWLPSEATGEVSRFAISKRRRMSCNAGAMVRLGLMKGLFRVSLEMGLTHWCAIMEPTLQRLLRFNGIQFQAIGPLVDFHGLRRPVFCSITETFDRVRLTQPDLWYWATDGGSREPQRAMVAA